MRIREDLLDSIAYHSLSRDPKAHDELLSYIQMQDKEIRHRALTCLYKNLTENKINRPDLLENASLSKEDRKLLDEIQKEEGGAR